MKVEGDILLLPKPINFLSSKFVYCDKKCFKIEDKCFKIIR